MPHNPRIADWRGRRAWIVGASSGIGQALALALLARGASVAVSARSAAPLDAMAREHPACTALPLDAGDALVLADAARKLAGDGALDLVVYCAGHYRPQRATAFDLGEMLAHQHVNYGGALNTIAAVLPQLLAQGHGHLSLLGSVAGYMGMPNALAYGPTKAALINLAQTLHFDLAPRGLGVSIVNPGFVETPLTAQNDFRMPALMQPRDAAEAMIRGWAKGHFEIHFPRRFSLALKAVRLLPFGWRQALMHRATGL
jgi:short-subunit dehydrogenase